METALPRPRSRQTPRTVVANKTALPGRRRLRLERKMANHGIYRLRPSRRTQGWPENNPAPHQNQERKPGVNLRGPGIISQGGFGPGGRETIASRHPLVIVPLLVD